MLWTSALFSSNTRLPSNRDNPHAPNKTEKPKKHQVYLVRESVSQIGTAEATRTQHYRGAASLRRDGTRADMSGPGRVGKKGGVNLCLIAHN